MLATARSDTDTEVSTTVETRPVRLLIKVKRIECAPQEIEEARSRGLIVSDTENAEEWLPNETRRLGWFWATDPRLTPETRQERHERLTADDRLIDMKGFARVVSRSYPLVKDYKFKSDAVRDILEKPEYLTWLAEQQMGEGEDIETVKARLLADAQVKILKAMPPRRDRIGQSSLWWVSDALAYARRRGMVDEWYEKARIRQTGRPVGSKTKHRRKPS